MASITLKNVSMAYPLLGSGVRRKVTRGQLESAGALIKDAESRSRSVQALRNITLTLKDGDRLGLVGRNGSGKSTLLRVMAGIYEPSDGVVDVQGNIASLFQVGLGISMESTGYRNIELLGLVAGYSLEEIEALKPEIAEFSGLGDYLNLPLRTYSNGMAMRLKFACGTAFSPEILLLDEWLAAGDPEFKKKARARMRSIVDKAGILVVASHGKRLIRNECNKVLWLHKGEMRALGDTEEVLEEMERSIA